MISGRSNIKVQVSKFSDGTLFESWHTFEVAWKSYCATHLLHYRLRSSESAEKNNRKRLADKYHYVKFHIPPEDFTEAMRVYYCTHGCFDGSRGKGLRDHRHFRFCGCPARLTAKGVQYNGIMAIEVTLERSTHRHAITRDVYNRLELKKIIRSEELGVSTDLLYQNNIPIRTLAEYISSKTGIDVSNQQVRNLCQARNGGPAVETRLLQMLTKFTDTPGNDAMVLRTDDDVVCGVVLISAAQKEMYQAWGECLLLDWTHHTNNLGFHLGELMVTAAYGKGVSACEMLVHNQRKQTLLACLRLFQEVVGRNITESFVIDKDFTEWGALKEVYPQAKVLPCQFHAVLAVQKKLAEKKYDISPNQRESIEASCLAVIYCSTESAFDEELNSLRELCMEISPPFYDYMESNWKNCTSMWAKHVRSSYFTAGNTTTNRLEASWRQMKRLLNLTTTLDKCLAGIFLYQNTIMPNPSRSHKSKHEKTSLESQLPPRRTDSGDGKGKLTLKALSLPRSVQSGQKNNQRRRNSTKPLVQQRLAMRVEEPEPESWTEQIDAWRAGLSVEAVTEWLSHSCQHAKVTDLLANYPQVWNSKADSRFRPTATTDGAKNAVRSLVVVFGSTMVTTSVDAVTAVRKITKSTAEFAGREASNFTSKFRGIICYTMKASKYVPRSLIHVMQDFHRYKDLHRVKVATVKWLDSDWQELQSYSCDSLDASGKSVSEVASDVVTRVNFTSLSTTIAVGLGRRTFPIAEVLRCLPGNFWLNDTVVSLSIQKMCEQHGRAFFVSPLCIASTSWKICQGNWEYFVAPCYVANVHWTLIAINMEISKAYVYDPLQTDTFVDETEARVTDILVPKVDEWRLKTFGTGTKWPNWEVEVLEGPIQGDDVYCGVLVTAIAWCCLYNKMDGIAAHRGALSGHTKKILRLRMLRHLLCAPDIEVIVPPPDNRSRYNATDADVDVFLEAAAQERI